MTTGEGMSYLAEQEYWAKVHIREWVERDFGGKEPSLLELHLALGEAHPLQSYSTNGYEAAPVGPEDDEAVDGGTEEEEASRSGPREDDPGQGQSWSPYPEKGEEGKPRAGLLVHMGRALLEVARVSEHGTRKYGDEAGWLEVEDGVKVYGDALWRHLLEWAGEDEESGLMVEAHVAWNAVARLELILREKEKGGKA